MAPGTEASVTYKDTLYIMGLLDVGLILTVTILKGLTVLELLSNSAEDYV